VILLSEAFHFCKQLLILVLFLGRLLVNKFVLLFKLQDLLGLEGQFMDLLTVLFFQLL
jgi:hypothetical protein